jgi:hypothetical protein
MQEERRQRTREAPNAPGRGEMMKLTGLGHERVKSPLVHRLAACARVESSNRERAGRRETAGCRQGVLSGRVVGDGESPSHGEGPDRSTQPAKETRAGHAGSGQHVPTSLRGIANRARESKRHRFRNLFRELGHTQVQAAAPASAAGRAVGAAHCASPATGFCSLALDSSGGWIGGAG